MAPAAPPPRAPCLVGREPLVRRVVAVLERDGSVMLVGPAGVGKSRVAAEASSRVAGRAVTVSLDAGTSPARPGRRAAHPRVL
jgi:MoxR-like ATPase